MLQMLAQTNNYARFILLMLLASPITLILLLALSAEIIRKALQRGTKL